jgi:DNA-binding transcriptional LysR family regulator
MSEKKHLMLVDQINLNHLRVFESVFRSRSMTNAAKELHLTQSGISQHIKTLEETLGIVLFDRHKQKIIPTSNANILYEACSKGFYDLERILWQITGKDTELHGLVKIGLPTEFGNNLILPIVSSFLKLNPKVKVEFFFGLASEVNDAILTGDLDYGYVDSFNMDKRVTTQKVYMEFHDLCGSPRYLKKFPPPENKAAYYEGLEYIEYLPGEPVIRKWLANHLKKDNLKLNVRAYVESPYSVLQLILADVGVGILPRHIVNNFSKSSQKLETIEGCGKPLKESIHVAYLSGRAQSRVASTLNDFISEELAKVAQV